MLLSLLSMLNVALLPIYDIWDGPFPENPVYTSLDVIRILISDNDALSYWVVLFSLALFLSGFITFLFALSEGKIMQRVIPALGILAVVALLLRNAEQIGTDSVIGKNANVCIGVWTGLLLLILSLAVACIPVRKRLWEPIPSRAIGGTVSGVQQPMSQTPEEPSLCETEFEKSFCPNCGQKIMKPSKFCGHCGFRLE